MKNIIIIIVGVFTSFGSFGQKAKANLDFNKQGTLINNYSCAMHTDEVIDKQGKCPKCDMELSLSKKEILKSGVVKLYSCPMHNSIVSSEAMKCITCGKNMEVIKNTAQIYYCAMHPNITSDVAGKCTLCNRNLGLSSKEKMKMEIMKIYTCPMHADICSNKNGNCPKCGMEMVEK